MIQATRRRARYGVDTNLFEGCARSEGSERRRMSVGNGRSGLGGELGGSEVRGDDDRTEA